jgi:hypothetical protein
MAGLVTGHPPIKLFSNFRIPRNQPKQVKDTAGEYRLIHSAASREARSQKTSVSEQMYLKTSVAKARKTRLRVRGR